MRRGAGRGTGLKPIRERASTARRSCLPDVVELARWTAEYLRRRRRRARFPLLLPPMARGGRADAHKTRRVASITAAGLEATDQATAETARGARTAGGLRLSGISDSLTWPPVASRCRTLVSPSGSQAWHTSASRQDRVDRDPFRRRAAVWSGAGRAGAPRRALTDEQDAALGGCEHLPRRAGFARRAAARRHRQRQDRDLPAAGCLGARTPAAVSLMLVPEIALTPAVAALFRDAFGERVAIQHSGLSDGERHDQWQRIRRGDVDVVVGTRSAVFAPLEHIGLIVVDEEHDASYKQEERPRYHGRDVAIVRARHARALASSDRRRRRWRRTTTP